MWWGLEQDPTSSKIRRDDDDDDDVIGRDKQNNKRIDRMRIWCIHIYHHHYHPFIIFVVKYDIVKIVLYVSMINYTFDVVEII